MSMMAGVVSIAIRETFDFVPKQSYGIIKGVKRYEMDADLFYKFEEPVTLP